MNEEQLLSWYVENGIEMVVGESPVNRLVVVPEKQEIIKQIPEQTSVSVVQQILSGIENLTQLKNVLQTQEICPLQKSAMTLLLGQGVENPVVLVVSDMPTADEDKAGAFLQGSTGALLQRMLHAIHLSIEENTYIANFIPWRTPGNRLPTDTEIAVCLPILKKQIQLLRPSFILGLGGIVSDALLGLSLPKARQSVQQVDIEGGKIPFYATYHPTVLEKNPVHRPAVWGDLQKLEKGMENNPTS